MKVCYKKVLRILIPGLLLLGVGQGVSAQNTLDLAGLSAGSPAYVAFSMRKLSTAYSGNAIQVRRSSDNTTLDIGFSPTGELDINALSTFVGTGNGFVSVWYDQSGNGRNMTQSNPVNQPRIVNGGVLDTENGKPFIRFFKSGTYNSLALPAAMTTVGMVSIVNKFVTRGFLLGHSSQYYWHDQPPKLFATYAAASILDGTTLQNGVEMSSRDAPYNKNLAINTVLPGTPGTGTAWDNIGRDRSIYNHTENGADMPN